MIPPRENHFCIKGVADVLKIYHMISSFQISLMFIYITFGGIENCYFIEKVLL
jgi:hypothetical protein